MTTVIAYRDSDGFVVGSDSACGDEKTTLRCGPKFFESEGIIWGLCGFVIYEQALQRAVAKNEERKSFWNKKTTANDVIETLRKILNEENLLIESEGFKEIKDSRFFFIEDGKMYYLDEDLSYWETQDPYLVIGSGSEFALGALHALTISVHPSSAKEKVEAGLSAAANFNPFVRAPFHIQEFKPSEA